MRSICSLIDPRHLSASPGPATNASPPAASSGCARDYRAYCDSARIGRAHCRSAGSCCEQRLSVRSETGRIKTPARPARFHQSHSRSAAMGRSRWRSSTEIDSNMIRATAANQPNNCRLNCATCALKDSRLSATLKTNGR